MKIKDLLLVGLFFLPIMVLASTDFRPGFIVNKDGVVMKGEIDHNGGNQRLAQLCRFRESREDYVMVYFPEDLKSFQFEDGPAYLSKDVKNKSVFMQNLMDGAIKLYSLENEKKVRFFIEKEGLGMKELIYTEERRTDGTSTYLYKSKKHIALYTSYMQDAPQMLAEINAMEKPERASLIKLLTNYHAIVSPNSPCTVYRNDFPIKLSYEVQTGFVSFSNKNYNQSGLQTGLMTYIPLNMLNSKTFLRTGLFFSPKKDGDKSVLKIPIQIQRNYNWKRLVPKVAYGVSLYPRYGDVTMAFMGGSELKLSNSFSLNIEYNLDFNHSEKKTFIPNKVYSQTLMAGLHYTF